MANGGHPRGRSLLFGQGEFRSIENQDNQFLKVAASSLGYWSLLGLDMKL